MHASASPRTRTSLLGFFLGVFNFHARENGNRLASPQIRLRGCCLLMAAPLVAALPLSVLLSLLTLSPNGPCGSRCFPDPLVCSTSQVVGVSTFPPCVESFLLFSALASLVCSNLRAWIELFSAGPHTVCIQCTCEDQHANSARKQKRSRVFFL